MFIENRIGEIEMKIDLSFDEVYELKMEAKVNSKYGSSKSASVWDAISRKLDMIEIPVTNSSVYISSISKFVPVVSIQGYKLFTFHISPVEHIENIGMWLYRSDVTGKYYLSK